MINVKGFPKRLIGYFKSRFSESPYLYQSLYMIGGLVLFLIVTGLGLKLYMDITSKNSNSTKLTEKIAEARSLEVNPPTEKSITNEDEAFIDVEETITNLKASAYEMYASGDWKEYTNRRVGYSFVHPPSATVKEHSDKNCDYDSCITITVVDEMLEYSSLDILVYYSNDIMDFDFDTGVEKKLYRKPQEISVGGEKFFLILPKKGNGGMIARDYKYSGEDLWMKIEYPVISSMGRFYISFIEGDDGIRKTTLDQYITVLESFRFI